LAPTPKSLAHNSAAPRRVSARYSPSHPSHRPKALAG
jgi:hypothetical protein